MNDIRHVEVVVPARNEEHRIAACLRSLCEAAARLTVQRSTVSCGITVVLDSCTDRTADVVREYEVHLVTSQVGCVGAARRIGTADAIARGRRAGIAAAELWIAGTDADTVVPASWLDAQVELADSGQDAVIGTVTPSDLSPQTYQRWRERYQLDEGHNHVHGANLGFRASAYSRAGGFSDADAHEDVDLVARIRKTTTRWIATHQTSVLTSGRTQSHVHGGFASYVAALDAEAI